MNEKKRVLFYLGHPAHFHLFKNSIKILKEEKHPVAILIKKKDVLENLVQSTGWDYVNINPKGRKDNKFSIALALLYRNFQTWQFCRKFRPDIMFGTSAEIAHVGRLMRIKSVVVNEDDAEVVPLFAKLAYPFAWKILAPHCCNAGRWNKKKSGYHGYHELAYLHPDYFTPDTAIGRKLKANRDKYFILRFAHLGAHHDEGKKGINDELANKLLEILLPAGNVYITSERPLEPEFEPYRIQIAPQEIHHALYFADLYIGDSQTMAAEAAVMGTPSIRFNDFVGQISYLEELEHKFNLTTGIPTAKPLFLLESVRKQLTNSDSKHINRARAEKMYSQTEDLNRIIQDFVTNC
ncbi:MAG: DUF354 domain-containing protein [Bacteroidia bacterium]|nr:DUF354 domain-containing protein [Bacteroidia bacterium]MCZ2276602.1 DUF354 domain-containing protein [Bacteroidia bacterium]